MRKVLLLLFILISLSINAQNSNLIIFSENDESFQVYVNGQIQNQQASTHVKMPGLIPATYRVKVKFADASLGQVSKNMLIESGQEYTVVVRKKKNTAVGGYFKEVGKAVDESLGNSKEDQEDASEIYVMRLLSAAPIPVGSNQGNGSAGFSGNSGSNSQNTQSQQNTNSSGNSGNGSGSISMNINASENGFNMNMDVKDETGGGTSNVNVNTNTQSTQSTQSSSWSSGDNNSGSSGAVTGGNATSSRCAAPMPSGTFASAQKSIDNQGFDESKLKVAKQAISANCMSVAQIAQIIDSFGFEQTKLAFAKYAYDYAYDSQNYFQLNDHFGFSSTVDELDSYIQTKR